MPNHDHTALSHPRAEKRQTFAGIYICVRVDATDALRDKDGGLLLAWASWETARGFAARAGMIVVNWHGFITRYLNRLPERPVAARIIVTTARGTRKYHAEFDASELELRTLNQSVPSEREHCPDRVLERELKAKVWEELS